jgi:hypothetical protein
MHAIKLLWFSLIIQHRQGISLFSLGPAIAALAVIPEFAQHVVEIGIGMFTSHEAATSLKNDEVRWLFGYLKIFGFVLAILASARFWWYRANGGIWYDVLSVNWKMFFIGITSFVLIGIASSPFEHHIPRALFATVNIILSIASLPFIFVMLAGLFGDSSTGIAHILRRSWPYVILLVPLLLIGFAPWQWLHGMNHQWALGADTATVWALMAFDSLVVGLMASLLGSGIAVSYMAFRMSGSKG